VPVGGHDDHTFLIGHHDVVAAYGDAAADDRRVQVRDGLLRARDRDDAAGEHREAEIAYFSDVADHAVSHEGGDASAVRDGADVAAREREVEVAGLDDDDGPGSGPVDRRVEHQVVAGRAPYGERRPAHARDRCPERADRGRHDLCPAEDFGEGGRGELAHRPAVAYQDGRTVCLEVFMSDVRAYARDLAGDGISTAWFEALYAHAEAGAATVPWADLEPNPLLTEWAARRGIAGPGRAAIVGCGYGDDAQFVAGLGFDVTAFDISPTAVEHAKRRFPATPVSYVTADLLDVPAEWNGAFDLVVEIYTVQVLQGAPRAAAIERTASLVAPGGTLLVLARARDNAEDPGRMPWPLTRDEIARFAVGTPLREVAVDLVLDGEDPPVQRWVADFRR
jgi:hypothetical protein